MVKKLDALFAVCATIGAVAFVIHLIVFYTAFHYASPTPAGEQTYGIIEHGHSAYVTYAIQKSIQILEIIMVAGLGIGIPGHLAIQLWRRGKRNMT